MKLSKLILGAVAVMTTLFSCSEMEAPTPTQDVKDFDLYNPLSGTSYSLSSTNEGAAFETFLWGPAQLLNDEVVSYSVEISTDQVSFTSPEKLDAQQALSYKMTNKEMNDVARTLGLPAGVTTSLYSRIVAQGASVSDTTEGVELVVSRFPNEDEGWVITGTATGDVADILTYDAEAQDYKWSIQNDFLAGSFLFQDYDGNKLGMSSLENGLVQDGDPIILDSKGDYTISMDLDLMKYKINKNETWYVTGSAVGGELLKMDYSANTWTIRADVVEGSYIFVEKYGDVLGLGADSDLVADGDSIKVSVAADLTIDLDVDAMSYTETENTLPANLYLIGSAVGGWDWDANGIEMVPVNTHPEKFWAIVYLQANDGFKFAPEKAWGNDKGAAGDTENLNDGSLGLKDFGGDNINSPAEAGYYMIVVDYEKEQILITEPTVYLMGSVIDPAWEEGAVENLFTIDNENEKLTITKQLVEGTLRMYADAIYEGENWLHSGWWQAEFMIFDDKIEYRGTGNDQAAVNLTGGEYTIDLNFKTGEGAIIPSVE